LPALENCCSLPLILNMPNALINDKKKLIFGVFSLLILGFMATSLVSYYTSKTAIRNAIVEQELPLTSDTIYSEIQKDLIRPIFISSMMSSDTFLRDWVLGGESDVARMTKYLKEVKRQYGAFTSFFISERTKTYYHADGILKKIRENEPRDLWYFRVRDMREPYEINVDPDLANRDTMTIFINYRVLDYDGRFIGATGIGLTVDAVRRLINDYQTRYQRDIFFVEKSGRISLFANRSGQAAEDIHSIEGLGELADSILKNGTGSYQYTRGGNIHLLNVRFIPELKWYLFVEKIENNALVDIQNALCLNIAICICISIIVLFLTSLTITRYQRRLEQMATTDSLSGLYNRHAFSALIRQAVSEAKRAKTSMAALIVDIDHFKTVNDSLGHFAGDQVIRDIAVIIRNSLRDSDIVFRWGGDEYLVILRECNLTNARTIAKKLLAAVENNSLPMDNPSMKITLSIGIATLYGDGSPYDMIVRADTALFEAKKLGRNCIFEDRESA
jgi:diguanylate cyclase (GGDEF)-like protein